MIPQVVRTVMQQGVRETSSVFKAIKISCRCVWEKHSTNSLAHYEIKDYGAHPQGAINTNSVGEGTARAAN